MPTRLIGSTWRCYCAGVGEDVTFDLGLIERFGCAVVAFDPTPRAVAHAEPIAAREPRFRFLPVGLWSEDTTLRFYRPADPSHVSHSAVNLQRTNEWFEAPVQRLDSLMAELGDSSIDLLKLDIEGAEFGVVREIVESGAIRYVDQMVVELHDGERAPGGPASMVRDLESAGLRVRLGATAADGTSLLRAARDRAIDGQRPVEAGRSGA